MASFPPPNKIKQFTVHFTWFHERYRVLQHDATKDTVRIYTRAYIMMLLFTQLFGDKSGNRVHIRWLPFVTRLDEMGSYSWASTALAWLYRYKEAVMAVVVKTTVMMIVRDENVAVKKDLDDGGI
ncbi:hypothetical protein Ahy_A04g017951 [Arachis hypogaea]|uniref:Aminotransferase-like plant mobile domain-containing protein n=1 Tax=Arachis hypogaea TaxID=3818 RepID=A0A445DCK4_ARAHY|nr:hypothetical protein Ahy_A04g017951 [Arachis hypogaea]